MNERTKSGLILAGVVIVAAGSIAYGALTAPKQPAEASPTPTPTPKHVKVDLGAQLTSEHATISGVLLTAYPKIATDYTVTKERLFDQGQWYGALLMYHGADQANRDTLRVLMQKKDGVWTVRTSPPRPLLSTVEFPDVPRSILVEINKAISLP
jgi:hypothetical protein